MSPWNGTAVVNSQSEKFTNPGIFYSGRGCEFTKRKIHKPGYILLCNTPEYICTCVNLFQGTRTQLAACCHLLRVNIIKNITTYAVKTKISHGGEER